MRYIGVLASGSYVVFYFLESKTKMYNLEVVVTEDVIKELGGEGEHWRWIDLVQV